MARMHTGRHGKSKSRKPKADLATIPENFNKEEVGEIAVNYAKQGIPQPMIGQLLKEKHNVPYIKHAMGQRLGQVLESNGITQEFPQDLVDLMRRAIRMRKHIGKNHNDSSNKRILNNTESKIWKLTKYYKSRGVLPKDWKYEPEKVELIIKS